MKDPRAAAIVAAAAAAADLRQVLRLIDAGEMYAESGKARAVVRGVEGAVLSLDAFARGGTDVAAAVEAGCLLRRLLDVVSVGDLAADSSRALALTYRLEGAVTALETLGYFDGIQ